MKKMRPKSEQVGRAHGLQRFKDLQSFSTIIDTTNTPHYVYSIKDSFKAVDRIRSIPTELFDEGYLYFFFFFFFFLDVTPLLTSVP